MFARQGPSSSGEGQDSSHSNVSSPTASVIESEVRVVKEGSRLSKGVRDAQSTFCFREEYISGGHTDKYCRAEKEIDGGSKLVEELRSEKRISGVPCNVWRYRYGSQIVTLLCLAFHRKMGVPAHAGSGSETDASIASAGPHPHPTRGRPPPRWS
jgi:hypothetical protein